MGWQQEKGVSEGVIPTPGSPMHKAGINAGRLAKGSGLDPEAAIDSEWNQWDSPTQRRGEVKGPGGDHGVGPVPGEGTAPEPSLGLLHPIQFHVHNNTAQAQPSQSQRIKGLANVAKGQSASDLAHSARELLFSGSNSPQHQLRGLTNTRGPNA